MSEISLSFGQYLKNLRTTRKITVEELSERIKRLYPVSNKTKDPKKMRRFHASPGYISKIEHGRIEKIDSYKIEAFAQALGDNPDFMKFKAGLNDKNPFSELKKEDVDIIKSTYLDKLCKLNKIRLLTKMEKDSCENVLVSTIKAMTQEG